MSLRSESKTSLYPIARARGNTAVPCLPHDIVVEILQCLPVKSLIRFKCVSKSWHDLISDDAFINLHLERAKKEYMRNCWLGVTAMEDKRALFRSMPLKKRDSIPHKCNMISLPGGCSWFAVGSCDGLVCLRNLKNSIILCNPATGAQTLVEPPLNDSWLFPDVKEVKWLVPSYGFGYASHDYKVVRIVEDCTRGAPISFGKVQIYSLREKVWKTSATELPDPSPGSTAYFRTCKFIPSDAMYWWIGNYFRVTKLLKYQLDEDKWSFIPLPSDYNQQGETQAVIGLERVRDHLCLLVSTMSTGRNGTNTIVFWISSKDAVATSSLGDEQLAWNKFFVMSPQKVFEGNSYVHYKPVVFLEDDGRVLFSKYGENWSNGMFYWLDVQRNIIGAVNDRDYLGGNFMSHITYIGSLVSLS